VSPFGFFYVWSFSANADTCYSYEVSRAFVLNGARVIMLNRKEEQGSEAISKIKEEAGQDAQIEWLRCDFGNLNEVKEVFSGIREREKRLDLVRINHKLAKIPRNWC